MEKRISDKEFDRIYNRLVLWTNQTIADMWKYNGRMVFSDESETASLEVDPIHEQFRINANPRYWKRLSKFQKIFVICHELLHLSFSHWLVPKKVDREWANIAQDIQVNEYIQKNFPTLLCKHKDREDEAWIASVFKDKAHLIKKDEGYRYYYDLLVKCLK